jgi:hypothetical protein
MNRNVLVETSDHQRPGGTIRKGNGKERSGEQQHIGKGDTLQRLGSAGLIVGAILFVTGGLLLPHAANPTSDVQEMLKPLGEHLFLAQLSALLMTIAIWALMIGVTGVYLSITVGGTAWARLGFNFALVGTALWTVNLALDSSTASAVAKWLAASAADKEAAWSLVLAINAVGRGVYPTPIIVYWLAYSFLDIGVIFSALYPRWLGWVGLIPSIALVAVGILQTFTERSTTLTFTFMVLALLTALWALAVGIWVARKAW